MAASKADRATEKADNARQKEGREADREATEKAASAHQRVEHGDGEPGAEGKTGLSQQDAEAMAERIRALNEQILEAGRSAGGAYLDMYAQTLKGIADYQQRVGGASQVDWVSNFANAQADFMRQMAEAYSSAARRFTK